jgi:hypothetical protein
MVVARLYLRKPDGGLGKLLVTETFVDYNATRVRRGNAWVETGTWGWEAWTSEYLQGRPGVLMLTGPRGVTTRDVEGDGTMRNPTKMSTGRTVALVAVGAAVLGGIGYYLYTRQTATTAAATTPMLPAAPPVTPSPVAAPTQTPTDQSAMNLAEQEASSSFESSIPD